MTSKAEKDSFSEVILEMSKQHGITHMEAILHHCEKSGLEVEVAATLVNAALKTKLEIDFQKLNFLRPKRGKNSVKKL